MTSAAFLVSEQESEGWSSWKGERVRSLLVFVEGIRSEAF